MVRTMITVVLTVVTLLLLLLIHNLFAQSNPVSRPAMAYSDFRHDVEAGKVKTVIIEGTMLLGTLEDERQFQTYAPDDASLVASLLSKDIRVVARPPEQPSLLHGLLNWLPLLLFTATWAWGLFRISRSITVIADALRFPPSKSP